MGRIVEPLYSSRAFINFLVFSVAATGAATFVTVTLIYYATLSGGLVC